MNFADLGENYQIGSENGLCIDVMSGWQMVLETRERVVVGAEICTAMTNLGVKHTQYRGGVRGNR